MDLLSSGFELEKVSEPEFAVLPPPRDLVYAYSRKSEVLYKRTYLDIEE